MKNKFVGCIVGAAIGDALGAPLESLSKEAIDKHFKHFNYEKCDYVEPLKGSRRIEEGVMKGMYTDDSQLTRATIWSIIYKGGINPQDIADQYAHVFQTEILRGWGRSTIQSVESFISGKPWHEAAQESVGIGNGCAMKAAPLGLVLGHMLATEAPINILHCMNSIVSIGKITHKDIGIRAGLLQSVMIALALNDQRDRRIILRDLKYCETELFGSSILSTKIERLLRLESLDEVCEQGGLDAKAENSWPTTIAVYLKTPNDNPIKKLFWLIKNGGDTDTCASMMAALIGAQKGISIFPQKLRRGLEDYSVFEDLAIKLYNSINNQINHKSYKDNKSICFIKKLT